MDNDRAFPLNDGLGDFFFENDAFFLDLNFILATVAVITTFRKPGFSVVFCEFSGKVSFPKFVLSPTSLSASVNEKKW